jgi:hypothetical protein
MYTMYYDNDNSVMAGYLAVMIGRFVGILVFSLTPVLDGSIVQRIINGKHHVIIRA